MDELWPQLLDHLASGILLPLRQWRQPAGRPHHVAEVEAFNTLPFEEIRRQQLTRLGELLGYAAAKSPFYRRRLAGLSGLPGRELTWDMFHDIPFLTREQMREQRLELLSEEWRPEQLRKSATGGTTTAPVTFYLDHDSYNRRRSATVAFDKWMGYTPGRRLALLWGARQDLPVQRSWKTRLVWRLVERTLWLPADLLDERVIADYARRLADFAPALLLAYPTPLALLAGQLVEQGARIAIPAIACTAEKLLPHQAAVIEAAFGVRPFEWYGAREAGRIATECSCHAGMHVNAYGLLVEIDPSGFASAAGPAGIGEIVITDLWNRATPLIRYRIGDIGRLSEVPCACGCQLPRLTEVLGRTSDVLVNSKGQRIPGVALAGRLVKDSAVIRGVQVIQEDVTRFRLLVAPGPGFGEIARRCIAQQIRDFVREPVAVAIDVVSEIPREPSGKVRFCKSLLGPRSSPEAC